MVEEVDATSISWPLKDSVLEPVWVPELDLINRKYSWFSFVLTLSKVESCEDAEYLLKRGNIATKSPVEFILCKKVLLNPFALKTIFESYDASLPMVNMVPTAIKFPLSGYILELIMFPILFQIIFPLEFIFKTQFA
jgi:hypothetical protein